MFRYDVYYSVHGTPGRHRAASGVWLKMGGVYSMVFQAGYEALNQVVYNRYSY